MGSYNVSEFKKGIKVTVDNEPYLMVDFEFMKPGKGQAVYRTKLKNLLRGNVIDRNYRSGDKLDSADVVEVSLQYLYNDTQSWHFMNPENFEQYALSKETVEEAAKWLKDETLVKVMFWDNRPIQVEPPAHVRLAVTYCEPAARGNTATGVSKPAKLETGAEVNVPAFINIGDTVRVDTRTGDYIERVSKGA